MLALRFFAKALFMPPLPQLLCMAAAWVLWRRARKLAQALLVVGVGSLYGLSTPLLSKHIVYLCERVDALAPEQLSMIEADAIVVLTGGQLYAPEFGSHASNLYGLLRLRYGAWLHRQTDLPILVSGGVVRNDQQQSLADTMAVDLQRAFGLEAIWRETHSRTTAENALFSYQLLSELNKTRVLLVTDALHSYRANQLFQQAGFDVIPAPTGFYGPRPAKLVDLIPTAEALWLSSRAIHEFMGALYYQLLPLKRN